VTIPPRESVNVAVFPGNKYNFPNMKGVAMIFHARTGKDFRDHLIRVSSNYDRALEVRIQLFKR